MTTPDPRATLKSQAVARAVALVESGMMLGLGAGSTALFALHHLADAIRAGRIRDVVGIPCSKEIGAEAQRLGVPLTTFDARPRIDLTIDGADEVDPRLNLIKGGGG